MHLGVDYYPEQWGLEVLEEDLQNIKELGCTIIRVGDFAWDVFEPVEGEYHFELFDQVIEKAKGYGLKVMMCTPTATMPRWLNLKYPEIMAKDEYGNAQPYGGRRGYCYNSDTYRAKALAITKEMAKHYKNNETIEVWQLDNEIGHEGSDMCYCESCHQKFIQYLKGKYNNIDELNQRWGTSFWTQTFGSFEEIHLPKPQTYTTQNPSLRLEWERFRSLSIEGFIKDMYDAVKNENPNAVVLHDLEGGTLEKHFNPFKVARELDDIAYNNYPVWGGLVEPMKPWEVALSLDAARGFRQNNFWITEEIMGAQGHDIIGCAPKPNQGSTWAIQALAHGCKSFMIFRYRGYTKGAEQYCYGILDSDNVKRRKYYEVKKLYSFIKENEELYQTPIQAKAAIVFDYDSAAALRIQRQSNRFNYVNEMTKLYKQLWLRDIPTDIVLAQDDLKNYQMVIIPYMIVMSEQFKEKIKEFVKQGGIAVFTPRTSWKDLDNNFVLNHRLPDNLEDLVGAVLEEQESLLENQFREVEDGRGYVFEEMLKPSTAKTLRSWVNNPFGNYSAVTVNEYGLGKCYYIATSLEEKVNEKIFDQITGKKIVKKETEETVQRVLNNEQYEIHIDFEQFDYSVEKK